ncbi:MAG TPA: hypothetical protein PLG34_05125 [Spirochaetota bacterium]|nr:MAG: hypothetical protein BWX91_01258 [Spirochaetes bacterium ADurb.Bin133]HPY87345.1 hypothetical protein [Spirochaetota bacterium]
MKFKMRHADKIVGIFLFLSIFILLLTIIMILLNQKTFTKKIYYKSRFADRVGLKINQDINFKGFVVGKITKFKLNSIPNKLSLEEFETHIMSKIRIKYKDEKSRNEIIDYIIKKYDIVKGYFIIREIPQDERLELLAFFRDLGYANTVDIDFFIYENYYDIMKENSVINKASNPLTGTSISLLTNNFTVNPAKPNSYIPSLDTDEGKLILSLGQVKERGDAISSIVNNVNQILASLNSDRNPEQNSISRILVNGADSVELLKKELYVVDRILKNTNDVIKNFFEITENFRELSVNMKEPEGLVKRLVDPDGEFMFNSIKKSLDGLSDIMEQLLTFTQFINGQSSDIETLLLQSKDTMKDLNDVIEGIKNNPLIKGGITDKKSQVPVKENIRDKDF